MKFLHQLIKYFGFLMIFTLGSGGTLKLENNNDETWNVIYDSSPEEFIAGFQFDVDGVTVDSAYGGAAQAAGFIVTASSTTVIGFSLSQATITTPMIGGILVILELSGEPTGLSNMVISDLNGNAIWDTGEPFIDENDNGIRDQYKYTNFPDSQHILGTDNQGRDVLSRLVYGFNISMTFALVCWTLSYTLGIIMGGIIGWIIDG